MEKPSIPIPAAAPRATPRADTFSIVGGTSVQWGVAGTATEGTILDANTDVTAKFEPLENQQGAVVGIVIYDTETVVKLTIMAAEAATLPTIGSTLTFDSISATVLKASKQAGNKTTVKFTVEANKWAHLVLGV